MMVLLLFIYVDTAEITPEKQIKFLVENWKDFFFLNETATWYISKFEGCNILFYNWFDLNIYGRSWI